MPPRRRLIISPMKPTCWTHTARLLADGKVVGWFHGRMEFGPRALGARSILGDARSPKMQATMNVKIKFRESFRPFAPVVLREHAHEWFGLDPRHESPYMLMVAPVLEQHRLPLDAGRRRSHERRSRSCASASTSSARPSRR